MHIFDKSCISDAKACRKRRGTGPPRARRPLRFAVFQKFISGVMRDMSKKQSTHKKGKTEIALDRDEADQLQMIVDRLAVQNPAGESFERYLHSLRDALSGRPHLAVALVDKLSRNPSQTGFRTARALENIIGTSPYRRHLKQAVYRFSQRGFVLEGEAPPPGKVVLIQGETRKASAHVFHIPGTLWLVSALVPESGPAGYALLTAFLEDEYRAFTVRLTEGTQKIYRDYLQRVAGHAACRKPLEVPPWHGAALFFEMLDLWTGESASAERERAGALLARYREPDRKPYVYELMPEAENPETHFPEIDVEAFLTGMDLSWLRFTREDLVPFHEKIRELDSPLLVVPREIQVERTRDVIRNAADVLCAGKTRRLFQRFFEEQAMVFKLCAADEKAMWAWVLAQHLAGKSSAGENPAATQLVIYSLRHHWPDDFGEKEPGASPERRTESGIILP